MARVNRNFFVIRISKELQQQRRKSITRSNVGYLGIKYNDQESNTGFIINSTEPDSPAHSAGFNIGDKIIRINDTEIKDYNDLINEIVKHKPLTELTFTYISKFAINDTARDQKKITLADRPLRLDIPDDDKDMRFNLQFGEIGTIGSEAAKVFPEAEVGDLLIVHHSVEYKQRVDNDRNWNDWHKIDEDENFEYRIAHCDKEVLGVWKVKETDSAKMIIPHPNHIFCSQSFKESEFLFKNGIYIPEKWEASMEDNIQKLEDLQNQMESLNTVTIMKERDTEENYKKKGEIKSAIDKIQKERMHISRMMHKKKIVDCQVRYVNPKTNEKYLSNIEPGDTIGYEKAMLYPLDLFGAHYVILRPDFADYLIKK